MDAQKKGLNEAQFRDEVRRELLMSEIRRNQIRQRINISDQEVQQVVKFLQSQGQKAQQYHVGHIMLASHPMPMPMNRRVLQPRQNS